MMGVFLVKISFRTWRLSTCQAKHHVTDSDSETFVRIFWREPHHKKTAKMAHTLENTHLIQRLFLPYTLHVLSTYFPSAFCQRKTFTISIISKQRSKKSSKQLFGKSRWLFPKKKPNRFATAKRFFTFHGFGFWNVAPLGRWRHRFGGRNNGWNLLVAETYLEPDGHLFINGCFKWMINQIFI